MKQLLVKRMLRDRRRRRIRARIRGDASCPRLSVFRSLKQIYAQLIDDESGRTLCAANSMMKEVRASVKHGGNTDAAKAVGTALAAAARAKGVERVVFDRGGYRYHGRVKALADGAREGGLKF
ncbi:MAG: 50S ribosomal protein L18 [Phycisphaerae bacterium]|nr:50S ribosomal protein L18 [Thauera sp.]MCK6485307.1 50S ribosomal protein L18 [Phycisphaerae bacterium]NUQ44661.1 50S ribosomal protein L18 [Phycisphaerae bacterium]